MTRTSLIALAGAAVLAGCGGGSSYGGGGSSSSKPAAPAAPAGQAALATSSNSLGTLLVDGKGRTLYMFAPDTPTASHCAGACAAAWPPAAGTAKPTAGSGVTKSKLTTIKRSDGTRQLAYAGHPLYRFAGDSSAGDATGQGLNKFGGAWHVVAPSGAAITTAPKSGGSSGSGYSRGGY
jgi:predicted lipoprotein with Yx(FWY)xxD motif